MTQREIGKLKAILKTYPEIRLVYFFGSRARQEHGKLGDYDFGVYLDTRDKARMSGIKIDLIAGTGRVCQVMYNWHENK